MNVCSDGHRNGHEDGGGDAPCHVTVDAAAAGSAGG